MNDGRHHVLGSACTTIPDPDSVQALRKVISCGTTFTRELLVGRHRNWFTGPEAELKRIQAHLAAQGLNSEIRLAEQVDHLPRVEASVSETLALFQWQQYIDLLQGK